MTGKSTNNRTLVIIIAILLLVNIGTICYFLLNKPCHKRGGHEGMQSAITEYLKKDIGFNSSQMTSFDTLSSIHQRAMQQVFDSIQMRKVQQFKELARQSFNDSAINAAIDQSSGHQRVLEKEMLMYMRNVRNLCTNSQLPVFDTGFFKLLVRKRGKGK